jgi:hypothetical protein
VFTFVSSVFTFVSSVFTFVSSVFTFVSSVFTFVDSTPALQLSSQLSPPHPPSYGAGRGTVLHLHLLITGST